MDEITLDEYRRLQKAAPKFSNTRPQVDGYMFDSKAEAERYVELKLMEAAGTIRELRVHPSFELQPAFTARGGRVRAIAHEVDFAYVEGRSLLVVEDVKGAETAEWRIKHKLFCFRYPQIEYRVLKVQR